MVQSKNNWWPSVFLLLANTIDLGYEPKSNQANRVIAQNTRPFAVLHILTDAAHLYLYPVVRIHKWIYV